MFLFNIQITSQSHHLFFHTLILENTEDDGFLWNKRVSKIMLGVDRSYLRVRVMERSALKDGCVIQQLDKVPCANRLDNTHNCRGMRSPTFDNISIQPNRINRLQMVRKTYTFERKPIPANLGVRR